MLEDEGGWHLVHRRGAYSLLRAGAKRTSELRSAHGESSMRVVLAICNASDLGDEGIHASAAAPPSVEGNTFLSSFQAPRLLSGASG